MRSQRNVNLLDTVSNRLHNKCVACYNLALVSLYKDDALSLFNELQELEIYVTPDMNVYKNLIMTGMDQLMFKHEFIGKVQLLEEMLYIALNGTQPVTMTNSQIKSRYEIIQAK